MSPIKANVISMTGNAIANLKSKFLFIFITAFAEIHPAKAPLTKPIVILLKNWGIEKKVNIELNQAKNIPTYLPKNCPSNATGIKIIDARKLYNLTFTLIYLSNFSAIKNITTPGIIPPYVTRRGT